MNFSETPMGQEQERAKTFIPNLVLMQASYTLSLEIAKISGSTVTWRELDQLSPEALITLKVIDLIQADREISC